MRNVILEGNTRIKTEKLTADLELHSGKPFMTAVREADKNRMLLKYGSIGFIDARIVCEPRFTKQLGVVDLIYKIEEREPFMMDELRIKGNGQTNEKVIQHEAVMGRHLPGEKRIRNRIEIFHGQPTALGYSLNDSGKDWT